MQSNARKCATQCTASLLVSTNPRRLIEGPIPLIFYHVRASTLHHSDWSMYVNGLRFKVILVATLQFCITKTRAYNHYDYNGQQFGSQNGQAHQTVIG